MAGPYDFESLYGLDPETAAALRSKYAPDAGSAVGGGAPAGPQGGAVIGQSAPVPPERQDPLSRFVSQNLIPGVKKAFSSSEPLVQVPSAPPPKPREAAPILRDKKDELGRITPAGGEGGTEGGASEQSAAQGQPSQGPSAPNYGGGGGGGPTVIPGGRRPSSSEVEVKRKGSPEDIEAALTSSDAAAGQKLLAADARLAASERDVATDLLELQRRKEVAERYEATQARVAMERQQYVEQQKAKLQGMSDDLAKDPTSQYWASKTDGEKVMGFLGVILSGIGAGLTGGPNLALQKIEGEINRSIANRREAYGRQRGIYQEMLQEYGDRATAVAAAKVAAYDKVAQDLAPLRAQAKTDRAKADWHEIAAGVQAQQAKARMEFGAAVETTEKSKETYRDPQVVGGGATKVGPTLTLNDGTTVEFGSEGQAAEAFKGIKSYSSLALSDKEALDLRAKLEKAQPGSADYVALHGRLVQVSAEAMQKESVARGQGAMTDAQAREAALQSPYFYGVQAPAGIGRSVIDPIARGAADIIGKRKEDLSAGNQWIRQRILAHTNEQRSIAQSGGGYVVERGVAQDAGGNLKKAERYTGQVVTPDDFNLPSSFKAADDRRSTPVAPKPLRETAPAAPVRKQGGK